MEQELLRLIEEGNLDYKEQAFRMVSTGSLGKLGNGDPAKDALRLSGESVQAICHRLGFGSQSYFGAQFKKHIGMTPTEYRKRQGI